MADCIGAVVLASGDSTRFSCGNKLLAPYQGKPLLLHTLDILAAAPLDRRLVVTRSLDVAQAAKAAPFELLIHDLPYLSDTIRLGVQELRGMDGYLFAVGDQPLLRLSTVLRLLEAARLHPDRIVRAAKDGQAGNPVIFPAFLGPELCTLPPGSGGSAVIRRHPELVFTVEAEDIRELMDVDTQQDYHQLQGGTAQ